VTGLAVLAAAMGGIAYLRLQDVAPTTSAVAIAPVLPAQPPAAAVPHAALAALARDMAVAPAGPATVSVPHAALAAMAGDVAAVPAPQAAVTVPHAALAALKSDIK
jgi:hypothetical protein